MGSQNPTGEKNKSPVGEEGGKRTGRDWEGGRDGEEDGKKRGIPEKRNGQQSNKASRVHVEQGKGTRRQSGSCPSGPAGGSPDEKLRVHLFSNY